jgi:hypothetical protein
VIDRLERLVLLLAALAVVAAAGLIGLVSALPGGVTSGIPDVCIDSTMRTRAWLDAERARAPRTAVRVESRAGEPGPEDAHVNEAPPASDVDARRDVPWVRPRPGVTVAPTRRVPELVRRKYSSLREAHEVARSGGGRFVETRDRATAYELTWLAPDSPLATMLDLRPGDRILSINGHEVGASVEAGRALFEALKDETRFEVLIERDGERLVIPIQVD